MKIELVVMRGDPVGKVLQFGPGDYYLGRGAECQVRLQSDWVSRQHCLLRVREVESVLADLGSTNGTLLNGILLVQERSLAEGDQIQIGPVQFVVRFPAHDTPPPPPEPEPEEPTSPEVDRLASTVHHAALPPGKDEG
jgi:pSer/pThr/pTyr-binding forkhead associated (FHA) protein